MKSFTIKVKTPKARGIMPPPSFSHRSKRNYSRKNFKNSRNW